MPKFIINFEGDVEIDANSEEEALEAALQKVAADPANVLMWDVDWIDSCRFCGCTEDSACEGGCGWVNSECNVCDASACLEKLKAEVAA